MRRTVRRPDAGLLEHVAREDNGEVRVTPQGLRGVANAPLVLVLLGAACSTSEPGSPASDVTRPPSDADTASPSAAGPGNEAWFTDRAEAVGLDFVHCHGRSGECEVSEMMAPALLAGTAVHSGGSAEANMGVDAGDFDADDDLFITHVATETNTLSINDGAGRFEDRSARVGLGAPNLGLHGIRDGVVRFR